MSTEVLKKQITGIMTIKISLSFFCLTFLYAIVSAQIPEDNKAISLPYSESAPYKPAAIEQKNSKKPKKAKNKSIIDGSPTAISPEKTIVVPLTVTDSHGSIVKNLQQTDFKILVDDQEIKDFSLEKKEEVLDIILLIDASPSTAYQMSDMQSCAAAVLEDLKPQDRVMVAEFSAVLKIDTALTADRKIIDKAIKKISFGDGTALYNALQKLFGQNTSTQQRRTAIIILSDGVDTMSEKSNYIRSLEAAERSGIPVFVVYVDTFIQLNKQAKSPPPYVIGQIGPTRPQKEEYERGKVYLNELVSLSGGRAFSLDSLTDLKNRIAPKFATEMRFKYYLKFTPPDDANIGIRKEIKIQVNRPGLSISAKGSFISE